MHKLWSVKKQVSKKIHLGCVFISCRTELTMGMDLLSLCDSRHLLACHLKLFDQVKLTLHPEQLNGLSQGCFLTLILRTVEHLVLILLEFLEFLFELSPNLLEFLFKIA